MILLIILITTLAIQTLDALLIDSAILSEEPGWPRALNATIGVEIITGECFEIIPRYAEQIKWDRGDQPTANTL